MVWTIILLVLVVIIVIALAVVLGIWLYTKKLDIGNSLLSDLSESDFDESM